MPTPQLSDSAPASSPARNDALHALRWDVEYVHEESVAALLLEDTEYRFGGVSPEELREVVSRLDGRRTSVEIAEETGLDAGRVRALAGKLAELGLAVDLGGAPAGELAPEVFTSVCRQLFPLWKERLFGHPLWRRLGSGEASRAQFVGWLIENCHLVEGVNERLSLAAAACPDPDVRLIFAHHYSEEYDHSHYFMEALNALGLDEQTVLSARPLPGSRAVLNHMRQCARRDSLQYAVCSGFLESTGTDRARARTFFENLAANYGAADANIIQPLVEHVGLDEAYGHNDLMEAVCEKIGPVTSRRASAALSGGATLVETLELWSTDIMRYYDRAEFNPRDGLAAYRPAALQAL